jgi:hypothetical protein
MDLHNHHNLMIAGRNKAVPVFMYTNIELFNRIFADRFCEKV